MELTKLCYSILFSLMTSSLSAPHCAPAEWQSKVDHKKFPISLSALLPEEQLHTYVKSEGETVMTDEEMPAEGRRRSSG